MILRTEDKWFPDSFGETQGAIIFDVDGTLYSQAQLRSKMLAHFLLRFARHPRQGLRAAKVIRAYRRALEQLRTQNQSRDLREDQLQRCCEQAGCSRAEAADTVADLFETAPLTHLPECVQPGLQEFLHTARNEQIRLGIVSDYSAMPKLEALGLSTAFDAIVSASCSPVNRLKPHPLALRTCLDQLHVEGCQAIYVGDRPELDVPFACNAGVQPVIIGRKRRNVPYPVIRNYQELTEILQQTLCNRRVSFA